MRYLDKIFCVYHCAKKATIHWWLAGGYVVEKKQKKLCCVMIFDCVLFQDSACEPVILRDINRTFPAHDYFKETGGIGQDSLYKLSKVIWLCLLLPKLPSPV